MATFIRAIVSLLVALAAFVVSFLVIFVPTLLRDMHYAPLDGPGGWVGFLSVSRWRLSPLWWLDRFATHKRSEETGLHERPPAGAVSDNPVSRK
jgi:hypothetical protein